MDLPSYKIRVNISPTSEIKRYTHNGGQEDAQSPWHRPFPPNKYRVGSAVNSAIKRADSEITHRADHIVKAHEVRSPDYSEDHGTEERPNEAFNCLLWREFDQGRAPEGDSPDVRKDIIADYKGSGDPEPDHAFQNVVDDEMARERVN